MKITELIKWYETSQVVIKYLNSGEKPNTSKGQAIFDFYNRCLKGRIDIVNYYLYGLKDRAIEKSRYHYGFTPFHYSLFEWYYDFPYEFAYPLARRYFDYNSIDLVSHRLGHYYTDELEKASDLYKNNKRKFYKQHFSRKKPSIFFAEMESILNYFPFLQNRINIFKELQILYGKKKWIGFYALALPQIEGLFSEMCSIFSDKRNQSGSLPEKVSRIRPFHHLSKSYFDYYQYHIPIQRNQFAHTGYDEEFELKSYDLLVDLSHLLQVIYELENPYVKLIRIHREAKIEDFSSVSDIVTYFKLVEGLNKSQLEELKKDIINFEKEFLVNHCGIAFLCTSYISKLPEKLNLIFEEINVNVSTWVNGIDFRKLNFAEIEKIVENIEVKNTLMYSLKHSNISLIEDICSCEEFFAIYKDSLPSLDLDSKAQLDVFRKATRNDLKKFNRIFTLLEKETVDRNE